MAYVNRSDAGQILLIAGLALALVFVGLALVLNSVIFTENLATRHNDEASSAARQFDSVAGDGVAEGIKWTNDANTGNDYSTLKNDHYQPAISTVLERLMSRSSQYGYSTSIERVRTHPGTQIRDDNISGSLTPASLSIGTWVVAPDSDFRRLRMTVVRGTLPSLSRSDVEDALEDGHSILFWWQITDATGHTWRTGFWKSGANEISLRTYDVTRDYYTPICRHQTAELTVDLAAGTSGGEHCRALSYADEITGKSNISYWNGDLAAGTYRITVDRGNSSLTDAVDEMNSGAHCSGPTYASAGSGTSPYTAPAVYSGTVDVGIEDQSIAYERRNRIEPSGITGPSSAPTVTSFDVFDPADNGSLTVKWETLDPQLDPVEVNLTLYEDNLLGGQIDQETGLPGSGSAKLNNASLVGNFVIELVANDGMFKRTVLQTHEEDGDSIGCPP